MPLSEQDKRRLENLVDQFSALRNKRKELLSHEPNSHKLGLTPEQHREFIKLIDQEDQLWAEFYSIVQLIVELQP